MSLAKGLEVTDLIYSTSLFPFTLNFPRCWKRVNIYNYMEFDSPQIVHMHYVILPFSEAVGNKGRIRDCLLHKTILGNNSNIYFTECKRYLGIVMCVCV